MKVQSFLGKVSIEALAQLDDHINRWMAERNANIKFVTQSFGYEQFQEGGHNEPVVVTQIWYE